MPEESEKICFHEVLEDPGASRELIIKFKWNEYLFESLLRSSSQLDIDSL